MKKLMSILVSVLFALSLSGLAFAQEAPKAPAPEKKVEAEKQVEKKKPVKAKRTKKAAPKKAEEPAPAAK